MRTHALIAGLALLVLAGIGATESQAAPTDSTRAGGAPVVFHADTLFVVHSRLGPFGPEERARAILGRLHRLSSDRFARVDSLVVSAGETSSDILSGDKVIMTITDADAAAVGVSRPQLAQRIARSTATALKADAHDTSVKGLLIGAILALLSIAGLLVALYLVRRLSRKANSLIEASRHTRIPALKIQKLEVFSADRIAAILTGILKGLRILAYVVLIYLFLPLILSFFPWTRGLAGTLFQQVLSPLGAVWKAFVAYLPNIFLIAVIVFATRYVQKAIRWFFAEVEKGTITLPNFYREWAMPTYKIVNVLVVAFAAVVIMPYLPGSDSPAFKGVSVFLGVLFSLGSASSISNVVAGVVLTYMRAFSVGDRVRIADTTGDVIEKTLLVTRVRTIKNVDITIANAMVLGSHIINFSSSAADKGLILHTAVTIGYDAPWKRVHELLVAAAASTENLLKEPAPFVLQTSLDDFFVTYEVNAYTDKPGVMARTFSDLHQNIQDKFNEAGVEIMSPHYGAVRDGNQIAIPETYLPKPYTAPGFRIVPGVFPPGARRSDPNGRKE